MKKRVFFIFVVLFGAASVSGTWMQEQDEDEGGDQEYGWRRPSYPVTAVMGRIPSEDLPSSEESVYSDPLRHHVDFDDLFPGGGHDQDAVESVFSADSSEEHDIDRLYPRRGMGQAPSFDDDLVVPVVTFRRMFEDLPQVGREPEESREGDVDTQPWLRLLGIQPRHQWWNGSNVCIKREDKVESSINTGGDDVDDAAETMTLNTTGTPAEFHMQFSACQHLDTKYSCLTKLYGPEVTKTIKTEYECCGGYELDREKNGCQKGTFEDITTTISQLGGEEFLRVATSVGVGARLEAENLTVFVPSDEALRLYMSTVVESNSIEFLPEANAVRRRRSILRRPKNDPQGLPVRRPGRRQQAGQNPGNRFDELGIHNHGHGQQGDDWKNSVLERQAEFLHRNKKGFLPEYRHEGDDHELASTILNHMVQGKLSTDSFVDEKVIYSENPGGNGVLRLNTWTYGPKQEPMKTINCARLISPNHKCTNGMVHLVDKVIKPVTQTIHQVLNTMPDLSAWKALLHSGGMASLLQDNSQHLTLFAPTNKAVERLGPSLLQKLRTGDETCLKRILRHHLLSMSFCSNIIYAKGQVRTVDHDLLQIERTEDDRILVNGSQIIIRDIVTINGVIHVLDSVIVSENDKPMTEILAKSGYSKFVGYLRQVGMDIELDAMQNVTVFAPTDKAFDDFPFDVISPADIEGLKELLSFHIASPEVRSCHLSHQQLLPTKVGQNDTLRINLYSSFPIGETTQITAQCGKLTKTNMVTCGGVIHELDRVLVPTDLDVVEMMKTQSDISIFSRLLEGNAELLLELKSSSKFHTIFAPTDHAFYSLPELKLSKILNHKAEAEVILRRHITEDSICCTGVVPNLYFMTRRVATLGDVNIPIYRDPEGKVVIGRSKATSCDLTSRNGIIHTIDSVLMHDDRTSRREEVGSCLPETLPHFDIDQHFLML